MLKPIVSLDELVCRLFCQIIVATGLDQLMKEQLFLCRSVNSSALQMRELYVAYNQWPIFCVKV